MFRTYNIFSNIGYLGEVTCIGSDRMLNTYIEEKINSVVRYIWKAEETNPALSLDVTYLELTQKALLTQIELTPEIISIFEKNPALCVGVDSGTIGCIQYGNAVISRVGGPAIEHHSLIQLMITTSLEAAQEALDALKSRLSFGLRHKTTRLYVSKDGLTKSYRPLFVDPDFVPTVEDMFYTDEIENEDWLLSIEGDLEVCARFVEILR